MDGAVLHHEPHAGDLADVVDRVAAEGDDVGIFPDSDAAEVLLLAQQPRGVEGCAADARWMG